MAGKRGGKEILYFGISSCERSREREREGEVGKLCQLAARRRNFAKFFHSEICTPVDNNRTHTYQQRQRNTTLRNTPPSLPEFYNATVVTWLDFNTEGTWFGNKRGRVQPGSLRET